MQEGTSKKLLMGNEAIAHAALEAGVRVVAGYPGTPSSEVIETIAKLRAQGKAHGVHVEWSTNEKSALEVLVGASYAGARCLFTCKQMGMNVAADALMSVNYVGIKGGLVLLVADDPGPISSQTEQDTRRFAAFAKIPVLDPATPEQAFAMTKAAFDLSEKYGTPVIVRPTTRIDHASTFFTFANETHARPVPEEGFERDSKWIIFPARAYAAHGEINDRLPRIAHDASNPDRLSEGSLAAFNPLFGKGPKILVGGQLCDQEANFVQDAEVADDFWSARLGIVAGGVTASYALEALAELEDRAEKLGARLPNYRFMQVGTPYPFPEEAAKRFVEGLDSLLVLEELDFVLEDAFTRLAGREHLMLDVFGKLTGHARDRGENDVNDVASRIMAYLGIDPSLALAAAPSIKAELPVRPPVLCPGCPHRGSFYAIKKALGKRECVLCGDIGCYTLGNAKPLEAVDTCLCMGAGITMAQGFSIAEPDKKCVAYVGDSTFFASGMTGIANAAYNGHDITVVVLDNATTAMTGAQPHPGTGVTLMGERREPLSIDAVLRACNITCIVHANPLNQEQAVAAAREAIDFEGPSAIVYESPCVQLIKPAPAVSINAQTCTGCKKCVTEIGCPGIGFTLTAQGPKSGDRGQAFVDPMQCNGCGLCVQTCPFKAIELPEAAGAEGGPHA